MAWLTRLTDFKGPRVKGCQQRPQRLTAAQVPAVIAPTTDYPAAQRTDNLAGLDNHLIVARANRIHLGLHVFWVGGAIGKGIQNNHFTIAPARSVATRLGNGWVILELISRAWIEQDKRHRWLIGFDSAGDFILRTSQKVAVRPPSLAWIERRPKRVLLGIQSGVGGWHPHS